MYVKEKQRKTLIKVLFGDITMTMNTLSENDKTEEMNNTSHKNKWPYKKIKQPNKK